MKIRNLYIFPTKEVGVPHLFIRWANGDEEIVKGFKPYFFIKSAVETGLKSWIDGFPVKKVECDTIFQLERFRKRFEWTGEADVPYLIRYALDMDLKYTSDRKIIYIDIEVGNPEEGSLDTKECPLPISLITVKEKGKTPLTFALKYEGDNTITFDDEQRLLEAFSKYIFTIKPDIIAGWNIISYDLAYLACRMRKLNLPNIFYNYRGQLHIHGTQSFDLLLLYKEYFEMGGRASLQNVAKLIGEEKKAPGDDFISYNQWDTILCEKIDNHYGIIDLMMTFQELAPIHISDLHRSALIDAYILKRARQRGIVMPTKSPFADINENLIGAEILAPKRGVFSNVVFYDIRSAYPNILLKRRICHEPPDQESLFLDVLEEIYETRLKWRALKKQNPYDEKLKLWDKAFKFLLNAQTGQLGYRYSRYYAPHLYNEMTRLVRSAIRIVSKEFKESILYADSVSGNAKVLIRENGKVRLIEIRELFKGDPDYINDGKEYKLLKNIETITFDGEKVIWRPIKYVMRHKTKKRMYRIHLTDFWHLDVTEDHSIYLYRSISKRGCKSPITIAQPKDIFKRGHWAIIPHNSLVCADDSVSEEEIKLWEFIGYSVGDGSWDKGRWGKYFMRLSLGDDKKELEEKLLIPLKKLGLIKNWYDRKNRKGDVTILAKEIRSMLNDFKDERWEKILPDYLLTLPKELISAFLRGYFSADGTVITASRKQPVIRLSSINENLIDMTRALLFLIGVPNSVIIETKENTYLGKPTGNYSKHIIIKDIEAFKKNIGFLLERKNKLISTFVYKKRTQKYRFRNRGFDIQRIKKVSEIEYNDYVHDIEVEDTHNFFANWILVHNTDSSVFQFKDTPEELLDELNALMERENIPLEFEIDKILKKIVFLGKKKNYFGLDTNGKLIYANMYAAQTACPIYCKRVLEEAMMKFLQGATLQEMREFIASKHREIYEVDMEDLTEERNTRKGTGVSFNYKAWLNHKKLFGEAPELPAKLALVPLRNGTWIILTEKSRSYCEENIDREVVFRKWILHPIEEIMKFLYQSNLFGFGK